MDYEIEWFRLVDGLATVQLELTALQGKNL